MNLCDVDVEVIDGTWNPQIRRPNGNTIYNYNVYMDVTKGDESIFYATVTLSDGHWDCYVDFKVQDGKGVIA